MLKRPLHTQFREPVLRDVKTTTIRDKAWPVCVPIMLYNWSGAPYRSKQIDVAVVVVSEVKPIKITHCEDGEMRFSRARSRDEWLFETEGFATADELHAWFRPLVKRGDSVEKHLMLFSRSNHQQSANPASDARLPTDRSDHSGAATGFAVMLWLALFFLMQNELKKYSDGYEHAAKELAAATAKIFAPGVIASATIGRTRFRGEVVSSGGCWWSQPDRVVIRNERTGKTRRVSATSALNAVTLG
jgi:hypothetical protein